MLANRVRMGSKIGNVRLPGPKDLANQYRGAGYYGLVSTKELFDGVELANLLGLNDGIEQFTDEPWLKFLIDGTVIYKSIAPYRAQLPWNSLLEVGAVNGDRILEKNGIKYKIRLMEGSTQNPSPSAVGEVLHYSEWNRLMLPIHYGGQAEYQNSANVAREYWDVNLGINFTDEDLYTIYSSKVRGAHQYCQETVGGRALTRGGTFVFSSGSASKTFGAATSGWSPVLEVIG